MIACEVREVRMLRMREGDSYEGMMCEEVSSGTLCSRVSGWWRIFIVWCVWVGERREAVYATQFWEKTKEKVRMYLEAAKGPVSVVHLGKPTTPEGVAMRIVGELVKRGEVDGVVMGEMYVPLVWLRAKREQSVGYLKNHGILGKFLVRMWWVGVLIWGSFPGIG